MAGISVEVETEPTLMGETSSVQQPNWLDLPTEILELILKKLAYSAGDIVRFKAVCCSWFEAANSYLSSPNLYSPSSQTPWLMLPRNILEDHKDTINSCSFFSIEEQKIYKIKNKFIKGEDYCFSGKKVLGSSFGWFVIFYQKSSNLILFNPCSKVNFLLPSIKNLLPSDPLQIRKLIRNCKAILSSDPSRTKSSWSVVLSRTNSTRQAIYMHGNTTSTSISTTTWTEFGYQEYCEDILWHNDKLYALIHGGSVQVWEFEDSFPPKNVASLEYTHHIRSLPGNIRERYYYLIESLEHVLLVVKVIYRPPNREKLPFDFYVFKLDYTRKILERLESLGDGIIFLSTCQSTMSISARNSLKCQKNSIYFIYFGLRYGERLKVGVYNLEEKVAKPCFYQPIDMMYVSRPGYWVVPNLPPPNMEPRGQS